MRYSLQLTFLMWQLTSGFSSHLTGIPTFPRHGRLSSASESSPPVLQTWFRRPIKYTKHSVDPTLVPSRGGAGGVTKIKAGTSPDNGLSKSKYPVTGTAAILASLWGTGGVVYFVGKAVKRLVPIALEPFQPGALPLSQIHLGAYIATCLWFVYYEGYKAFQLKFSPLVVKRSFTLIPNENGTRWYHFLLAPMYSMGLIHATRKRQIVSWAVTTGIALIIALVKRLPYPWRNIVDGGAVAGLSWGLSSIVYFYLESWWTGQPPSQVDACLPIPPTATTSKKKS